MADYIPFADPDLALGSSVGALPAGSLNSGNWGMSSVSGFYPSYAGGTDTTGTSSMDLTKTLQGISKGFADSQSQKKDDKAPQGAAMPQIVPPGQPMRRVALDQLVQLLNKQRDTLLDSAITPGGQAQPYNAPRTIGLLGF
jgi:hypothetical protein